jgi:3,4-dihydroxy 2-butanone 4-phosphate synthase/GTP cyclohydrolase II
MKISIEEAIERFQNGEMLIMSDSEDRENEGDFIMPASAVTPEAVNFAARYGRGLICVTLTEQRCKELRLQMMVQENTSKLGTNFTISVDAAEGTTTGISCEDRAKTIKLLADPEAGPDDFGRPGHIFPIRAVEGGVLERPGHTEGASGLARYAGLEPVAMLCEILNEDGTMARMPDLEKIAAQHNIPLVTIHDLITWRIKNESHVRCAVQTRLPTDFGEWELYLYEDLLSKETHVVLAMGDFAAAEQPLVRIHSQCFTGDTLRSHRCDCRPQLEQAMAAIAGEGCGILLYMMQEGRGIGLTAKIKAYALQDKGLDTVEANEQLGYSADLRDYAACAQILKNMGVKKLRLLTNNPEKVSGLQRYGFEVQRLPLEVGYNLNNMQYLKTKRSKLGHLLTQLPL